VLICSVYYILRNTGCAVGVSDVCRSSILSRSVSLLSNSLSRARSYVFSHDSDACQLAVAYEQALVRIHIKMTENDPQKL
jgi:hypothetical protein